MQLFSQYLRDLIQVRQMNISALARLSGVERTALSKTLAGQRVLPYDALDGLINHLRLTPDEEGRLRDCYDAQFEKEGIRRSRAMVGRMFADLAELDFAPPAFEESRLLLDLEGYAGRRSIFNGTTNVQPLLRMVLSQELTRPDARVELTVPRRGSCCAGIWTAVWGRRCGRSSPSTPPGRRRTSTSTIWGVFAAFSPSVCCPSGTTTPTTITTTPWPPDIPTPTPISW